MPKRTRQQKERAKLRRVSIPQATTAREESAPLPLVSPILSPSDLTAIKRDLIHITLLSLLAIGVQIGLLFILR